MKYNYSKENICADFEFAKKITDENTIRTIRECKI